MSFCPKCGAELPEGAEFCPKCGANLKNFEVKKEENKAPVKKAGPIEETDGKRLATAIVVLVGTIAMSIVYWLCAINLPKFVVIIIPIIIIIMGISVIACLTQGIKHKHIGLIVVSGLAILAQMSVLIPNIMTMVTILATK